MSKMLVRAAWGLTVTAVVFVMLQSSSRTADASPPTYVQEQPYYQTYQVPKFIFRYVPSQDTGSLTQDQLDALAERVAEKVVQKLLERQNGGQPIDPTQPARPPAPAVAADRVLATYCAGCHMSPNAKGGFTMFDAQGKVDAALNWSKAVDFMTHEDPELRMPPKNQAQPTAEDVAVVRRRARDPNPPKDTGIRVQQKPTSPKKD